MGQVTITTLPPAVFLAKIGQYALISMLMLYLIAETAQGGLGMQQGKATAVFSLFIACRALGWPVGGFIAVLAGAGLAATLGAVLAAVGMVLIVVPSQGVVVSGLFLVTLGTVIIGPSVYVMAARQISDSAPALRVLLLIGITVAMNLGTMCGPLAGMLGETLGFQALFIGASLVMLMSGGLLALAWWGDSHGSVGRRPVIESQRWRPAAVHLGAACLWWWANVVSMHYTNNLVDLEIRSRWIYAMPILWTLAAVGVGLLLVIAHLRRRFSPTLMIGAALACMAVHLLLVHRLVDPQTGNVIALYLGSFLVVAVSEGCNPKWYLLLAWSTGVQPRRPRRGHGHEVANRLAWGGERAEPAGTPGWRHNKSPAL